MRPLNSLTRVVLACVAMLSAAAYGEMADARAIPVPIKAPAPFLQAQVGSILVRTDVSQAYLQQLCQQVAKMEQRMGTLFKLSDGFMRGNDPKTRMQDKRFSIPGDQMAKEGVLPWIELRVYKNFEGYCDEWFMETDRIREAVNKKKMPVLTPEQRVVRRMTEGVAGAYFMIIHANKYGETTSDESENKYMIRRVRAYLGSKSPDEVEADILHETGHLFLETYLMVWGGTAQEGHETEKRGIPAWINEGTAVLLGTNWASSREATRNRLKYLAWCYEGIPAGETYPFSQLADLTNDMNIMDITKNAQKGFMNYAQSYCIMNYMIEKDWVHYLPFLENVRGMHMEQARKTRGAGVSECFSVQAKAFKEAFGIDFTELEKYWKTYIKETMEKEFKKNAGSNYWCGLYHLQHQSLEKAEACFKKAIDGAPKQSEGYLGMGQVNIRKKDYAGAVTVLTKATELNPKDDDAFYYLGMAQLHCQKPKEAIAAFQAAVKLYPLNHVAHSHLSDAYFQAGQYKEAMDSAEQAFKLNSNNPNYLFQKGHAAFFNGDYAEAMRNFNIYASIFQRDPEGHFWYGMTALRQKQKEFAIKELTTAAQLGGDGDYYKMALQRAQKDQPLVFQGEKSAEKEPAKVAGAGAAAAGPVVKAPPTKVAAPEEE
ncbi:MAG TPA: tetratricopeptide repeat protein [Planctomycetota bacterium]|jgi:tetratricopeptide (TPR) repeat protein